MISYLYKVLNITNDANREGQVSFILTLKSSYLTFLILFCDNNNNNICLFNLLFVNKKFSN